MVRALISVSDKTGLVKLGQALVDAGVEIISTGGTKATLDQAGIPTMQVEEVTSFPEMMDGRVKTLHPLIHGGLLGLRDNADHQAAMQEHGIVPIDFVVVNLYPFKETILKDGVTTEEAIENIDIGGPSMIRSAAKNYQSVTVICDPADYTSVIDELKANGQTSFETRQKLAAKAFRHTGAYDALIGQYFTKQVGEENPESLTLTYDLKQELRYGENSHQKASFYENPLPVPFSIAQAEQLHGKELSFNNIKDANSALAMAADFQEPVAVAVKHMNPCGIAIGDDIEQAFERCYQSDPVSIFGGIVVLNRPVTVALAEKLNSIFLEIVIAPSYEDGAFEILSSKKNIRLMTLDFPEVIPAEKEYTSVRGGLLVQDADANSADLDAANWKTMTEAEASEDQVKAMEFAWKVVKHVKSNAIVLTNQYQTLGIGAGQMNRVGAAKIAIEQAEASELSTEGMVLASDAFFPMDDTVELAANHGVKAIVQPGGSLRDQDSVDMANKHGIVMMATDTRHFRH